MKIFVIGAEGQVGECLMRELAPQHKLAGADLLGKKHPVLDIRNAQAVNAALDSGKPDFVVLTAAFAHVDGCEEFPEKSQAINVQGTENVAKACGRVQAGMVFFSTDYIFDGQAGPYSETDQPHPLSVYGQHKWQAEQIISRLVPEHLIVRTMNVYSYLAGSVNFFMQLHERLRKGEPITAASDQMINPTQAVNLAQAVGELLEQGATGIFNLAGTTRLPRDEFARQVVASLGYDPGCVKSQTTAEFKQRASRPLNSGFVLDKAQARLKKHPLWDLKTSLDFTLTQMKGKPLIHG